MLESLHNLLIHSASNMMQKIALKLRIRTPKRRSPAERLRSRLYYRRNRVRIRVKRRRYLHTHKSILRRRKLFQRFKPTWYRKKKPSIMRPPKPHKPKKFKVIVPKSIMGMKHRIHKTRMHRF